MNIPAEYKIGVGLGLVAITALWLLSRNAQAAGKAVAGAAGNLAGGVALGALTLPPVIIGQTARGYSDWANSDENPLKTLGDWLGGKAYDLTHWR
jgi:hypothetical protein